MFLIYLYVFDIFNKLKYIKYNLYIYIYMSQLESSNPYFLNKCKLVYNTTYVENTAQNILLISSCVTESQLFYDSVNNNTFPIIYSPDSDKNELIELLRNKFQDGIKRITFAFHDPLNNIKTFLDNKPFFDESDLIKNQTAFSETVTFLINLISEFKIKNCDFLACNTLQYSNWKKYYELLNKLTNVICGASNDKTGNIQYGADWVMENTNENIRDIYFTNSINNYASSLAVFTIDNLTYTTSGSNASVTGFSSPPSNWDLTIPTTVTNASIVYNVTSIGNFAFYNCSQLKSVIIQNSVTIINAHGFRDCINLISVTIPTSVTSIGELGFLGCRSLITITIPNSVTTIGNQTFQYCYALISITLPNLITTIGNGLFYDCNLLTSITIPNSVTSIGNDVFYNCSALSSIIIPNSITLIGSNVFVLCTNLTSITVNSDNLYYSSDSGILFNKLKTTLICFPGGLNISSYTIPNSVTTIGASAFYKCVNLTSVTITSSVTTIGDQAFLNCFLTTVIIPDSVTTFGNGVFQNSPNLTTVTIGNSITSLNGGTFYNCSELTTVTIGNSVTSFGWSTFRECHKLNNVVFPDSVISVGDSAFNACYALTNVTLNNSLVTIDIYAFFGCPFTSITIPDSVTSIRNSAFRTCSNLTSITIPSSVTSIGFEAFETCPALATVYFLGSTIPSIGSSNFTRNNDTAYHIFGATNTSILSSIFTTVRIITPYPPTIQPWYSGGIKKLMTDTSFTLIDPTSTSPGGFTYSSSNPSVATIDGNLVTIVDRGSSTITVNQASSGDYSSRTITTVLTVQFVPSSNICFLEGTPVRTDQGLIHIDKINPDLHTIRNKKIVAITKTSSRDKYLVCFEKNSLGHKMPSEKTIITYNHKILYNGKMIKAKHFIENFENVHNVNYNGELLYNVLLEEPSKMIVNNLICETLHPDNLIAQIYRFLPNMNLKEQDELITRLNKDDVFTYNN